VSEVIRVEPDEVSLTWSGGSTNLDPTRSLGGGPNATAKLHDDDFSNLFLDVTELEARNGVTQYRCIYAFNGSQQATWSSVKAYVSQKSQDSTDIIAVGNGIRPAFNNTGSTASFEPGVTNQNAAPTGVVFSTSALAYESGVSLGNIPPLSYKSLWVRRQTRSNTAPLINNYFTITVNGRDYLG
jgi:hypothetical protein